MESFTSEFSVNRPEHPSECEQLRTWPDSVGVAGLPECVVDEGGIHLGSRIHFPDGLDDLLGGEPVGGFGGVVRWFETSGECGNLHADVGHLCRRLRIGIFLSHYFLF